MYSSSDNIQLCKCFFFLFYTIVRRFVEGVVVYVGGVVYVVVVISFQMMFVPRSLVMVLLYR